MEQEFDASTNTIFVRGVVSAQQVRAVCAWHGDSGNHEFDQTGADMPENYIGSQIGDDGIRLEFSALDGKGAARIIDEMF